MAAELRGQGTPTTAGLPPEDKGRSSSIAEPARRWQRVLRSWRYRSIWFALAALFVLCAILQPNSLNITSLASVAISGAILMIVATGQTLVMQQRGIDLSVPGTFSLCSMLPALLITGIEVPFVVAIVLTLFVALVIGLVNGLLVTRLGITPLIATLAVNSLVIGTLYLVTNDLPSANAPPILVEWAVARVNGIPVIFILAVVTIILLAIFMSTSTWGRRFVGVGLNPSAVRAAGYLPERYVVAAFIISSVAACIGGLLLIGYLGSARATAGDTYLFTSIAAPVLGGLLLAGGRGSVIATAGASFFLVLLVQVLLTAGASPAIQLFAQALAIAVAVALRAAWPRLAAGFRAPGALSQKQTPSASHN
jgi:ribose transport system permease protein